MGCLAQTDAGVITLCNSVLPHLLSQLTSASNQVPSLLVARVKALNQMCLTSTDARGLLGDLGLPQALYHHVGKHTCGSKDVTVACLEGMVHLALERGNHRSML